jgi:hypothetical protein
MAEAETTYEQLHQEISDIIVDVVNRRLLLNDGSGVATSGVACDWEDVEKVVDAVRRAFNARIEIAGLLRGFAVEVAFDEELDSPTSFTKDISDLILADIELQRGAFGKNWDGAADPVGWYRASIETSLKRVAEKL